MFGTDYPTPDGTCIRDYVHVTDLADAHLRVLARLEHGSCRYNVGSGTGYSVREVIEAVERVGGRPVPHRFGERRAGDPAVLVASSQRLREDTGLVAAARRARRHRAHGLGVARVASPRVRRSQQGVR